MPWGVVASVGGAVVSHELNKKDSSQSASGAADPFASQRPQYQAKLAAMMNGDYQMSSDPSYQYQLNQGSQNLNRQMAATGQFASGHQLAELQTYGQQMASADYSNQYNRLAQLAGANVGSPAAAGQILANQQNQNQAAASSVGNMLGGALATGAQGIYNYYTTPTSDTAGGFAPSYGSGAGGYDTTFGGATTSSGSFF